MDPLDLATPIQTYHVEQYGQEPDELIIYTPYPTPIADQLADEMTKELGFELYNPFEGDRIL